MNRAEARIKKFQNSTTQLAGRNNPSIYWWKDGVVQDEMEIANKLGRKKKKK